MTAITLWKFGSELMTRSGPNFVSNGSAGRSVAGVKVVKAGSDNRRSTIAPRRINRIIGSRRACGRTATIEALIARAYLSGTNTR